MKEKYWDIVGEHFGNSEKTLVVLYWIWVIGLAIAILLISIQTGLKADEALDDIWPFFQVLGAIITLIITVFVLTVLAFIGTIPAALITLAITGLVCLFTGWYAHANQEEEPSHETKPEPKPIPPPPKPKPAPPTPDPKPMPEPPQFTTSPPPPPPSKPRITAAQARQRWEDLISNIQAVGREIDLVASSAALRNEFEVLRAAVLHEGGINLANEQWEDLEVIVKLTQDEIDSLSPVNRSLSIFGITRNQLTLDRLKQRHRELAKAHHPDTGPATVPDRMSSINESYQTLKKYLSTR